MIDKLDAIYYAKLIHLVISVDISKLTAMLFEILSKENSEVLKTEAIYNVAFAK